MYSCGYRSPPPLCGDTAASVEDRGRYVEVYYEAEGGVLRSRRGPLTACFSSRTVLEGLNFRGNVCSVAMTWIVQGTQPVTWAT